MSTHPLHVGQVSSSLFNSTLNLDSRGYLFLDFFGFYGGNSRTPKRIHGELGVGYGNRLTWGKGLLANNWTASSTIAALHVGRRHPQIRNPRSFALSIPSQQPGPRRSFAICNFCLKTLDNSGTNEKIDHGFTVSTNFRVEENSDADPDAQIQCASNPGFAEFAKNVSGEWDGYGADFTKDGKPIELPEYVVPEAYREWEVKVFDWQTQCPTLAQPEPSLDLRYKVIRLLPTVGCEADAATRYSVEERCISNATAFAYRSSGCYVAVWSVGENLVELEHCLVDPRQRESRVRLIQVLKVDNEKTSVELQKITVFKEQWYGPFRNGDQLGGCAIRDPPFASTAVLESSRVSGVWEGLNATANFSHQHKNIVQEVVDESRPRKSYRDGSRLVLLPNKLWCSLDHKTENDNDGETWSEVGWILDQGLSVTSKCLFSWDADFSLKKISMACENPVSMPT